MVAFSVAAKSRPHRLRRTKVQQPSVFSPTSRPRVFKHIDRTRPHAPFRTRQLICTPDKLKMAINPQVYVPETSRFEMPLANCAGQDKPHHHLVRLTIRTASPAKSLTIPKGVHANLQACAF